MLIYHGSNMAVEIPELREPNRALDFGGGFYATTNLEQAKRFAKIVHKRHGYEGTPTVSIYEFDENGIPHEFNILRFDSANEDWFDFVCDHRRDTYAGKWCDIAIGAVANDRVYATIGLYESEFLSKEQAIASFKVNPLFDQVVFKTEAALSLLTFRNTYDPREREE